MTIIFAFLLFSFLIFIHELGHFVAAKLSGVQVNEFALFMGPALWKKQVGETNITGDNRLFVSCASNNN
ncbi:MAG: site-2 protease family protein [Clostridia bacterium]|nr:site-2 protease family protein [Clostridia bacterium]